MNKYSQKSHGVGLIIVLGFLLIVSILCFAVLALVSSQHGITYSYQGLDEIRYACEFGFRHALWIWRYKYPAYLKDGKIYDNNNLDFESYNVKSIEVQVQDRDSDRKLDIEEEEIRVLVNEKPCSF